MNRTLTVLLLRANHPDDLDAMEVGERRSHSGGWTRIELRHPGKPDVLVRKALDLDMGVFAAAPEHDPGDESCLVETSLITRDHLEYAAGLLTPHVAEPLSLAERLIAYAGSQENPEWVARVLVEASAYPASGPAEEAAAYVRIFLGYVKDALAMRMGIAWELRTYEQERPAVSFKDVLAVLPGGWAEVALGTPAPNVKWMRRGDDTLRLVQNPDSVTVTNAEGIMVMETELTTLLALKGLQAWVAQACALMGMGAPKTTEQREADRQAVIPPDVEQVMEVLRAGKPIQIGGRSSQRYELRDGQLVVTRFEDGVGEEFPCTEETLRAAILDAPNAFNDVIRWHRTRASS